jgi:hypothetical protein
MLSAADNESMSDMGTPQTLLKTRECSPFQLEELR